MRASHACLVIGLAFIHFGAIKWRYHSDESTVIAHLYVSR